MRIARSMATQHITREYKNFWGPPRVSQIPSSGWSQLSQTQFVRAVTASHSSEEISSFVNAVEDVLFHCVAKREAAPIYKQDEVQLHCYDEYSAYVDKDGIVSQQLARVRIFCLAFLSGSPFLEVGLNDRRRQGKGRKEWMDEQEYSLL